MVDLKEQLKSRNIYSEGQWSANIPIEKGFMTEIGIKGNENGVSSAHFLRAEKVLKELDRYRADAMRFLQRYVPDDEDEYELFTITVDDFTHGYIWDTHAGGIFGIKGSDFLQGEYSDKTTNSNGFTITFCKEFNETDPYLLHINFAPIDPSETDFIPISIDTVRF